MRRLSPLFLACILLSACGRGYDALPEGRVEITGILQPAELSLVRRGTHILQKNTEDLYYVESSTIALKNYEGERVTLGGTVGPNISEEYLPVLRADSIEAASQSVRWEIPEIGIAFDAPLQWEGRKKTKTYWIFSASGTEILSLRLLNEPLPKQGGRIIVGGKQALRRIDEKSGTQDVFVDQGSSILLFSFTPPQNESGQREFLLRSRFLQLLKSVLFIQKNHEDKVSTGTGGIIPCGGSAGVLCSNGYYCVITDLKEDVGHCEKRYK